MKRLAITGRIVQQAAFAALALTAANACTAGSPAFETVSRFPDEPRHAPGVAVDPTPALPAPTTTDSANHALVVLRTPADPSAARAAVRAFFKAVVEEQPSRLDALLSSDAWMQTNSRSDRQPALPYWQSRLAKFNYGALRGQLVYRESEMETYRPGDLARLKASRRLPLAISNNQVLIRVPIATPRVGHQRLFADEMLFVLRPKAGNGRYVISGIDENFQIP